LPAADYYRWRRWRGVELGFLGCRGGDAGEILKGIEEVGGVAVGSVVGGGGTASTATCRRAVGGAVG
jgi:hypothetical protein